MMNSDTPLGKSDGEPCGTNFHLTNEHVGMINISSSTVGTVTVGQPPTTKLTEETRNEKMNKLNVCIRTNLENIVWNDLTHPITHDRVEEVPIDISCGNASTLYLLNECNHTEVTDATQNRINIQDLFSKSKENAQNIFKSLSHNRAKDNYINVHGNIVGICGPSGMGKSTLAKATAKIYLDSKFLIFFIQLKDVNYKSERSLLEFLISSTVPNWKHNAEEDKQILEIINESKDVIIILDGLNDAALGNQSKESEKVNIYNTALPEIFIKNLLSGYILPDAKKLITSRAHNLFQLHHAYKPKLIVTLLGLNKTSQKNLCKSICKDNFSRVYECISEQKVLRSYCRNPLFCILCSHYIDLQLEENNEVKVLGSMTKILSLVVRGFVENQQTARSSSQYCPVAKLAWESWFEQKTEFTTEGLKNAGVNENCINIFFYNSTDADPPYPKNVVQSRKQFIHPIFQEFFSAVYLCFFASSEKFEEVFSCLLETRYETVMKFIFGLCNPDNQKDSFIEGQSVLPEKISLVKRFVLMRIDDVLSLKDRNWLSSLMSVCCCVFEMHDNEFARNFAFHLSGEMQATGTVVTGDVAGFNYVLRSRSREHEQLKLSLGPCLKFDGNSLVRFLEELQITLQSTNLFIRKLDLSRTKNLNKEIVLLCKCLQHVQILNLTNCDLSAENVKLIADAVDSFPSSNFELNLSWNNLSDANTVSYVASCTEKLAKLYLSCCKVNQEGMELLSRAIHSKTEPLKHFCISGNITSRIIELIASCVVNIDYLVIGLEHDEVTDVHEGICILSSAIFNLSRPMEGLCILGSRIGDSGIISIAGSLKNIKKLRLGNGYDKKLSLTGIQELSSAISRLEIPLQELILCCSDQYSDEASIEFMYCRDNISHLEIRSFHHAAAW